MPLEKLTLARIVQYIFLPSSRHEALVSGLALWCVATLGVVAYVEILYLQSPGTNSECMECFLLFVGAILIEGLLGGVIILFSLIGRTPPHWFVTSAWTLTFGVLSLLMFVAFDA